MTSKVIVYSQIFPPKSGGSGRWFFELYRRLTVIEPVFLVGEAPGDKEFDQSHANLCIHRYQSEKTSWGFQSWHSVKEYWRQFRTLSKVINQHQIKEVHCGRILPEGVPALLAKLLKGVPYSCYIHGEDIEVARTSRELTLLTKLVMRYADRLICNSKTTQGYVERYWSAYLAKTVVLHPGVDTDFFQPLAIAELPDDNRPFTLLTVGRLQQRKGHDVVIKAIAELKKRGVFYQYRIAGDGEEKPHLQALCTQLGVADQVVFLQEISDEILKHEYQHCDLFILANRRVGNDDEGFGMVLLEAQACGKPVIAGRSGGTWETMQEGQTGWLVDCTDEIRLVQLLENQEVQLKAESYGETGRRLVAENFSWIALAQKASHLFINSHPTV